MTIQTGYAIASISALKALTSSQRADSYARLVKSIAWYIFDASSTATADDDLILMPNDNPSAGRWIKIGGSGGGGSSNINFTGSIICTSSCGANQGKAFHFDSPQSGFIQIVVNSAMASNIYPASNAIQISLWAQEPNTSMYGRQFVAQLPKTGGKVFIATDDYRPWISVQARNTGNNYTHDGVCCTFSGNTVTLLAF